MTLTLSLLTLILALACFITEAVRNRSVIALGLALWVLSQVLARM